MANKGDGSKPTAMVGRTWPDLVTAVPIWLLAIAGALFVGILVYSIGFATRPYSLGFLGEFGPRAPAVPTAVPTGFVVGYTGGDKCPAGWARVDRADGRMLIGSVSPESQQPAPVPFMTVADLRVGETGGTRVVNNQFALPPTNIATGSAVAVMADSPVIFATQGGALARFYVLPPYLAVIFCTPA